MDLENQVKISILNKLQKINSLTDESALNELLSNDEIIQSSESKEKKVEEDSRESIKNPSSVHKFINTLEIQRRKEVISNVQERLKKIEDFTKQQEIDRKRQWLKKQQEFVDDIQQKENHIFQVLEEYDKSSLNNIAQRALYYRNLKIERQEQENEIKRRELEKQIIYERIDKIKKLQLNFRSIYEQILSNIKRCTKINELKIARSEEFKSLNLIRSTFEGIINKCKSGKVTEEDVEKVLEIFIHLQTLGKNISESTDEINAKDKIESWPKTAASEQVVEHSVPDSVSAEATNISKYVGVTNLKTYLKLMDFFEKHLQSFNSLENDISQKQFFLDCKKAINIPVNSLSGLNSEHILDKYSKLYKLLKGQDVIVTGKRINASNHPKGIFYCINFLAKRFVQQSDLIISSNPKSAFCYATVIMSLWNEFPEFGQILLTHFYKSCPSLVPYHIPRQVGESDEEYYKRQGYQYSDGQIEKQDKFLKRMTGLMRLYTALMIVKPKKGHANNYNIQNGWKWLSSMLKLEPQIDISATLVHTFLETAGFELDLCYRIHFQKLIRIIVEKFLPSCKEKCTGGAVTSFLDRLLEDVLVHCDAIKSGISLQEQNVQILVTLELLISDYYQNRKFKAPDGYMDYNYW